MMDTIQKKHKNCVDVEALIRYEHLKMKYEKTLWFTYGLSIGIFLGIFIAILLELN